MQFFQIKLEFFLYNNIKNFFLYIYIYIYVNLIYKLFLVWSRIFNENKYFFNFYYKYFISQINQAFMFSLQMHKKMKNNNFYCFLMKISL
jgi:hypothetical protein